MPHTCHARNCNTAVPRKMLMCRKHWRMVPRALQNDVWAHYQSGQEEGMHTPTEDWHKAADAAIKAVRIKEGIPGFQGRKESDATPNR